MPRTSSSALYSATLAGAAAAYASPYALELARWLWRRYGRAVPETAVAMTEELWRTTPVTRHMGLHCVAFDEGPTADASPLVLEVPLRGNTNMHGTAFAGSLYSAAVLAGYSWADKFCARRGLHAVFVVKSASIRYRAPTKRAFVCVAQPPSAEELERFAAEFRAEGKATLPISVTLWPASETHGPEPTPDGKPAVILDGLFVALPAHGQLARAAHGSRTELRQ